MSTSLLRWATVPNHHTVTIVTRLEKETRTIDILKIRRQSFGTSSLSMAATSSTTTDDADSQSSSLAQSEEEDRLYRELQWLSQELRRHDELYYNLAESSSSSSTAISDDEYDALAQREAWICQNYPKLQHQWEKESNLGTKATRYGGRVGMTVDAQETKKSDESNKVTIQPSPSRFVKRVHVRKMLSLDNVHSNEELLAWLERIRNKLRTIEEAEHSTTARTVRIRTEPKLDGLSLSLHYVPQNRQETDANDSTAFYLQWAATRGDGSQGQDVTTAVNDGLAQSQTEDQPTIPLELDLANLPNDSKIAILEVRGEVVLPESAFNRLSADTLVGNVETNEERAENTTLPSFSNARNAASGILLRKDDDTSQELSMLRQQLRFYAYDVVAVDRNGDQVDLIGANEQHGDVRDKLESFGFTVPEPVTYTTLSVDPEKPWLEEDIKDLLIYYAELSKHREGETSRWVWGDYGMDGCVHKVCDPSLRQLLGASNRAPRWAVAHKFPPRAAVTKLLDIEVQIGRTGALTPVAILDPVDLGGVLVQRATLHNFAHMQQVLRSSDRVIKGCPVLVRRAGDVIPQVVSRVDATDDLGSGPEDFVSLVPPTSCPACGSEAVADESSTRATNETVGQVIRCGGPSLLCPPRAALAIQHAFSRDALDVTGLSEARIRQLMEAGLLSIPSDLFRLVNDPGKTAQLEGMDGWGPKSVANLKSTVNRVASDGVSLARFIYSLGIRFAGVHSSALVASIYGNVEAFLRDVDTAAKKVLAEEGDEEDLFIPLREDSELTKGVGPALLSSLATFAANKDLVQAAHELADQIAITDVPRNTAVSGEAEAGSDMPLYGMTVVFTGSIPDMSRTEAQRYAKELGAKSTSSSVSKSTNLVVAGAKSGKKRAEASKLGVKCIEAEEFVAMVAKHIK